MSFEPLFKGRIALTEQEKAIEEAIDAHQEAHKDYRRVTGFMITLFIVGAPLYALSPKGSTVERFGFAFLGTAFVLFPLHLFLEWRDKRKFNKAQALAKPYWKSKMWPTYALVSEKLKDEPNIEVRISDAGLITVANKRIKFEEGGFDGRE